jgi:hypothetical protein
MLPSWRKPLKRCFSVMSPADSTRSNFPSAAFAVHGADLNMQYIIVRTLQNWEANVSGVLWINGIRLHRVFSLSKPYHCSLPACFFITRSRLTPVMSQRFLRVQSQSSLQSHREDDCSIVLLGAFANSRKATSSFVMCVCRSVRIEQHGSHWADFDKIWYLTFLRKSVEKIQV